MSAGLVCGQTYEVVNLQSGKVLDVTRGVSSSQALQNGTLIQQWDYLGGTNQQWQLTPTASGYNAVVNQFSGKVLDVTGGFSSTAYQNGTQIQQWSWLGNSNQEWSFVPLGNGYNAVYNLQSGKVLDVTGGFSAQAYQNGTVIQQWDWLGGANQQWQLVPVNPGGTINFPSAPPPPVPSNYSFALTYSGLFYPPNIQTGDWYYYCYNPSNNQPIEGCGVTLGTGYAPYTNAHFHESGSHVHSTVSPTSGYTNSNGELRFTISTSLIGQVESAYAVGDFGDDGFDFAVGYVDLVYGDIPFLWTRIGGDDTGGGSGHGTTDNNRAMMLTTYSGLYYATVDYLQAHPGQSHICVNDAALPIGGKFDISRNWSRPHAEHDRGSAVDVATTTSRCPANSIVDGPAFVRACIDRGAVFAQVETANPHVHCNWLASSSYPH